MKLAWPFLPFVSSLLSPREQGFDAVDTLYGQREGSQFFAMFGGRLLWTAPYEIKYCKNVLWTRIRITSK